MDSQTSATTPAAEPAQPHERPGAAAPPGAQPSTQSPAGAATASHAVPGASATPAMSESAAAEPQAQAEEPQAGFGSRGRRRRRARFLRKARELAYRDLGGLVFSLHRFGQRNDSLVLAKLATLGRIDAELRALEDSLAERRPVTVLREAGITACPRCAAIHSGEDRFCPSCGLSMSRRSDLPIAGAPAASTPQPAPPSGTAQGQATPAPAAQPPTPTPATAPASVPSTSPAGTAPATAQHAVANPPAGDQAQPHAAPQPATQAFDAIPAGGGAGRSPAPPRSGQPQDPAPASGDDQPTEIIRPPAPGS